MDKKKIKEKEIMNPKGARRKKWKYCLTYQRLSNELMVADTLEAKYGGFYLVDQFTRGRYYDVAYIQVQGEHERLYYKKKIDLVLDLSLSNDIVDKYFASGTKTIFIVLVCMCINNEHVLFSDIVSGGNLFYCF